ncbi:hypothetical protein GF373_03995 [bacterium]|nr:hypothetical protein [bacterium]
MYQFSGGTAMEIKCPYCQHEGEPIIKKQVAMQGWVVFIVLLIFCFPICWLPFLFDGCYEEVRICTACQCKLG